MKNEEAMNERPNQLPGHKHTGLEEERLFPKLTSAQQTLGCLLR